MKAKYFAAFSVSLAIMYSACSNPKDAATSSSDSSSAVGETAPATSSTTITGVKWKLIELMGQPVADSINGKEPFITFKKEDSSYAANGGCNGLGGKFELNEKTLRITFKQGMSTMMACADMTVENGLKKVFEDADNYTMSGDSILSLNKARMAPLARFRKVE
jgi:heat shock protein HslJ